MEDAAPILVLFGVLLSIIIIIVFFVLADNVGKLRREAQKQTKLLRLVSLGPVGIVGQAGVMQTWAGPEASGTVRVLNEDWDCHCDPRIESGTSVRVVGQNGLMLTVSAAS